MVTLKNYLPESVQTGKRNRIYFHFSKIQSIPDYIFIKISLKP